MMTVVEHSIGALCSGENVDLMDAPASTCAGGSNGENSDDSGEGDSSPVAATSSNNIVPAEETTVLSSNPTQLASSATVTTSPAVNDVTSIAGASTSPTSQATLTIGGEPGENVLRSSLSPMSYSTSSTGQLLVVIVCIIQQERYLAAKKSLQLPIAANLLTSTSLKTRTRNSHRISGTKASQKRYPCSSVASKSTADECEATFAAANLGPKEMVRRLVEHGTEVHAMRSKEPIKHPSEQ